MLEQMDVVAAAKLLFERAEEVCCGMVRPITKNSIKWGIKILKEQAFKSIDDNAADQDSCDAQKLVVASILNSIKNGAIEYYRRRGCLVE